MDEKRKEEVGWMDEKQALLLYWTLVDRGSVMQNVRIA